MKYQKPELVDFTEDDTRGACIVGSGDEVGCADGNTADLDCADGVLPGVNYSDGGED